ncbi:MAG: hypothetical protein WA364_12060 [Candidatus Nitrosopolaris sp.]
MSAKPVIEEGERIKGGAPTITPIQSTIQSNAVVLHQSEEDDLFRHIEKTLEPGESMSHFSENRKALVGHFIFTAGLTSIVLFTVVIIHETYLIGQNRPLTLSNALWGAFVAALAAFGVEAIIIGLNNLDCP